VVAESLKKEGLAREVGVELVAVVLEV